MWQQDILLWQQLIVHRLISNAKFNVSQILAKVATVGHH
jgi:hypothetical protein